MILEPLFEGGLIVEMQGRRKSGGP
jgi:hypothetical protein